MFLCFLEQRPGMVLPWLVTWLEPLSMWNVRILQFFFQSFLLFPRQRWGEDWVLRNQKYSMLKKTRQICTFFKKYIISFLTECLHLLFPSKGEAMQSTSNILRLGSLISFHASERSVPLKKEEQLLLLLHWSAYTHTGREILPNPCRCCPFLKSLNIQL